MESSVWSPLELTIIISRTPVSLVVMLDGHSSWHLHFTQNASLVLLSLLFLPIDTLILIYSYALQTLIAPLATQRRKALKSANFQPRRILVTGVGMAKGLSLARLFYQAGHDVIGADFETHSVPVNGRFSRALKKFYALPKPNEEDGSACYIYNLLRIVRREKIDLWVSCSGVASAVEDGEAKEAVERETSCKAIQFDIATTAMLHEKHTFIHQTKSLGLPTPETYDVTSRTAVHRVLHGTKKKKYIMKSVGVDDASRGDMTILPRRTLSETYNHISNIAISSEKPWVLQQFIHGKEYCTHALVVNGQVKAFVACPSLELLMHYKALPTESALSQAMFKFTEEFVSRNGGGMTGHLSFDFLAEETATEKGVETVLQPIECNPRAHTAVVLFNGQSSEMAQAYMSALATEMNGNRRLYEEQIVATQKPPKYYWVGHDLVTIVLWPLIQILLGKATLLEWANGCFDFLQHLLLWRDGTYEIWDPLPWWWLYHVYWPGQFLACIYHRRKWSRINVSTTKIFGC